MNERVYQIYRRLGMDWREFQQLARRHGLQLSSPHESLSPTEVALLERKMQASPLPSSELLAQLRGVLMHLPESSVFEEIELILSDSQDQESLALGLAYCREHVDANWWSCVDAHEPFFDWRYIEPTEGFWQALEQRATEHDELGHGIQPHEIVGDISAYFRRKDDPGIGNEYEPEVVLEGLWNRFGDGFWWADSSVEGWREALASLRFWDAPAHHQRCWSWVRGWSQEPSLEHWNHIQRLSRIWAEGEPTRLLQFELRQFLGSWESHRAELFREFFDEFAQLCQGFDKGRRGYHSGLRFSLLSDARGSQPLAKLLRWGDQERFVERVLAPRIKQDFYHELHGASTRGWHLTLSPANDARHWEELFELLEGELNAQISCQRERARRLRWIREGFQGPGVNASLFIVHSNYRLTCCGSNGYVLETPSGYYGLQHYNTC